LARSYFSFAVFWLYNFFNSPTLNYNQIKNRLF